MSQSEQLDRMDGDGRSARISVLVAFAFFLIVVAAYAGYLYGKHNARTTIIHIPDCSDSRNA